MSVLLLHSTINSIHVLNQANFFSIMLLQVNIIRVDFAAYKYYYLKGNANGIQFLGKFVKHARINTSASQARDS